MYIICERVRNHINTVVWQEEHLTCENSIPAIIKRFLENVRTYGQRPLCVFLYF